MAKWYPPTSRVSQCPCELVTICFELSVIPRLVILQPYSDLRTPKDVASLWLQLRGVNRSLLLASASPQAKAEGSNRHGNPLVANIHRNLCSRWGGGGIICLLTNNRIPSCPLSYHGSSLPKPTCQIPQNNPKKQQLLLFQSSGEVSLNVLERKRGRGNRIFLLTVF